MKKKNSLAQYPYIIWNILFVIVPIFLVLYFSLINKNNKFTLENYSAIFHLSYINVFWKSIKLSVISTILCLAAGYPIAHILANLKGKSRNILMMLLIIPMWMNFLLRTYAWMSIIGKNGVIHNILKLININNFDILYTSTAVVLGMVYNFLPFMIIPIYTVLIKLDKDVLKAAADLGADKLTIFRRIVFPLSIPGVMSGINMVFMPAVSTFVISNLLGGGQFMLIGNLIELQFTSIGNWYLGSSISIIMMLIILLSMAVLSKYDKDNDTKGGAHLW